MAKSEIEKLKQYLENYLPVDDLMISGFFEKGTKRNDYEKIAARICWYFGYKSIYEYKKCCNGRKCDGNNCDGSHKLCNNYNHIGNILKWPKVEVCQAEMAGNDSWLN